MVVSGKGGCVDKTRTKAQHDIFPEAARSLRQNDRPLPCTSQGKVIEPTICPAAWRDPTGLIRQTRPQQSRNGGFSFIPQLQTELLPLPRNQHIVVALQWSCPLFKVPTSPRITSGVPPTLVGLIPNAATGLTSQNRLDHRRNANSSLNSSFLHFPIPDRQENPQQSDNAGETVSRAEAASVTSSTAATVASNSCLSFAPRAFNSPETSTSS